MIGSNGLALDRKGRLIIATCAGRSIDRIEKNGKRIVLADRFEGKQFNGTNDVIVKKNGTIYFTDTYGGLRLRDKDPRKGLDFQGVYMIRSEEHTSELQSRQYLVCRLLLEKKNTKLQCAPPPGYK